jgi:hypothetical protein
MDDGEWQGEKAVTGDGDEVPGTMLDEIVGCTWIVARHDR